MMPPMMPWGDDERVPCVCNSDGRWGLFRAEIWISEHVLAGRCPRHSTLEKYRDRLALALAEMD